MASFPFLSDEWWEAAEALREEYRNRLPNPPVEMRMNQVVTDIPFGESTMEMHTITTPEDTTYDRGLLDDAELTVTADYDTAKSVIVDQDQQAVMAAFMSGKIKVVGDMSKLLAANAVAPNAEAMELANKIRDITA